MCEAYYHFLHDRHKLMGRYQKVSKEVGHLLSFCWRSSRTIINRISEKYRVKSCLVHFLEQVISLTAHTLVLVACDA